MAFVQHALFPEVPRLPEGFRYEEELLSPEEERALMSTSERLPFREFEFRGFRGKRRTVSFGWRYDFNVRELQPTETIPTFLLGLHQKAAEFASLSECDLQHALVTEYSSGAAIGWHKDRIADVIGPATGGADEGIGLDTNEGARPRTEWLQGSGAGLRSRHKGPLPSWSLVWAHKLGFA
jgi:hypothetical protein